MKDKIVELPSGDVVSLDYGSIEEMLVDVKSGIDSGEIQATGAILVLVNGGQLGLQFRTEDLCPATAAGYLQAAQSELISEVTGDRTI